MSQSLTISSENFSRAVFRVVKNITPGKALSYGDVARKAGFPGAARAVGSLMRKNYDKAVPCHRVIRSDGSCGEYNRGGSEGKAKRLRKEGVEVTSKIVAGKKEWFCVL